MVCSALPDDVVAPLIVTAPAHTRQYLDILCVYVYIYTIIYSISLYIYMYLDIRARRFCSYIACM